MLKNMESQRVTTLYLVRHGDTVGGTAKGYKGTIDVPLSDEGIREMRITADFIFRHIRLSSRLRKESYLREIHGSPNLSEELQSEESSSVAIYCSPLTRARESAEIIGGVLSARPRIVEGLKERHFGIWEGKTFREIKRDFPREFSEWAADPVRFSPPQGETTLGVLERTVSALADILRDAAGRSNGRDCSIVIVGHGGVNRVLLCHILDIPLHNIFRIEQDTGALSIIEFWGNRPVVKSVNLSPGMIRLRECPPAAEGVIQ